MKNLQIQQLICLKLLILYKFFYFLNFFKMNKLKSDKFFKNKKHNIIYNIIVCNNNKNIVNMIKQFKNFNKKNSGLIGIDFEFNRKLDDSGREIALIQINLENKSNGDIFIFNPNDLNKSNIQVFISLLTNTKIKKIVHGAEALDIPYIFNSLLLSQDDKINFCKNLFDTRYMCEFYNFNNNKDYKCKIYYLLYNFNVINKKQFNFLIKNEEEMGSISEIRIDINNMSKELILYTVCDVIYLPELLSKFPNNNVYKKIIPELTSVSFILKNSNFFNNNIVNKYNINFVKSYKSIKMIDIYYLFFYWVQDDEKILNDLLKINYFKKFFDIIIKKMVYNKIFNKYKVFVNNNTSIRETIVLKELDILSKFPNIDNFITSIQNKIEQDLDKI
jgi:hypothetical protein